MFGVSKVKGAIVNGAMAGGTICGGIIVGGLTVAFPGPFSSAIINGATLEALWFDRKFLVVVVENPMDVEVDAVGRNQYKIIGTGNNEDD